LQAGDLDHVIPHQTSERTIGTGIAHLTSIFGQPGNVVYNVERYGNTASTSHFLALHGLLEERRLRAGERVALLCFASGIVVGMLVFTVDQLAEAHGRNR
jgi:3-oxoacyl-[acyl-carrier-protein] synthase-3